MTKRTVGRPNSGWVLLASLVSLSCAEATNTTSDAQDDTSKMTSKGTGPTNTESEDAGAADADDASNPAPRTEPDPGKGEPSAQSLPLQYVRGDTAQRLVIELDYVKGRAPSKNVIDALVARFEALLDKPKGIEVLLDEELEPFGDDFIWRKKELFKFSEEHFSGDDEKGTVKMHVVFVDGVYEEPDQEGSVLGLAWANRFVAMFDTTVADNCEQGGLPLASGDLCEEVTLGVWSHEVGHVIGLVDNGLEMVNPHKSKNKGAHEAEEGCLMYWAYDGPSVVDVTLSGLLGGKQERLEFCEGSLADIRAAQE